MKDLSFFDNLTDAVCVFNENKEIIFSNKTFLSFFKNFTTFEKLKKYFNFNLCLLSSDDINSLTPLDFVLNSKESFHTVATYQNQNGNYTTFYIHSFGLDGSKAVILKNITDEDNLETITDRYNKLSKKFEEEQENKDKLIKMQEQAQVQALKMGIINRISLVIRETNDMETILASTLEEIHNLLGSFKTYFSMKENTSFVIKSTINGKAEDIDFVTQYEDDILNRIKNKDIFSTVCLKEYLNSNEILERGTNRIIIPVYNKKRLLGIIVSLTKHKFSIEENREILQSISVQLASSIIQAGLIRQLNKKNTKLEETLSELKETQLQLINTEKMASVGQLVSGVAHEINTPLSSISSNNKLINKIINNEREITPDKLNILKELNNIDIEAANRISEIVKSLKRFVRLDEAEFQEADINSEIDLTLKLTAHELKNNISVEKEYGDIPPVKCSVNMLNQVFMNLIVNACHSIAEKKEAGIIKITTLSDGNNLTVKIKDSGCGISEDIQNKIFNVGFTTKPKGIGTGLGLSISKKIIELHKGTLSFTSNKGMGTEFTITIPLNLA